MLWTFLLLFSSLTLFYTPLVSCQKPEIVDAIHPEVKRIGETAFLNCTVVRKDRNIVSWTHVNSRQPLSSDEKIVLSINDEIDGLRKFEIMRRDSPTNDRITFMLIVRSLREDDAGKYRCAIEIQGKKVSEWPQRVGELTVQVPPRILTSSTTRVEAKVGDTVMLLCNATGIPHPNITWVRANGDVLPTMQFSHRNSKLVINNIQRTDQGVYRCVADNTVRPPDQYETQVLIFSRPLVQSVQNTVGQAANGKYSAILECKIAAYPDAVLRWYKKTSQGLKLLNNDDKYNIQKLQSSTRKLGETWYYLKVKNIQANDFGDYFCEGSNSQGTQSTKIILFETMECQGPMCFSPIGSKANSLKFHFSIIFSPFLNFLFIKKCSFF